MEIDRDAIYFVCNCSTDYVEMVMLLLTMVCVACAWRYAMTCAGSVTCMG